MYRLLIETLLGLNLEGDRLRLSPCLPASWSNYKVHYRYRRSTYHISISRASGDSVEPNYLSLDGQKLAEDTIPLSEDGREHFVELRLSC